MATSKTPQTTDFSRDVLGRYICNGFDEAKASHNVRPFDIIIVGGGTFGSVLAEHLWFRGTGRNHRILVLEGGPFNLTEHVQNLPVLNLGSPGAGADINNSTTINELRANNQYGIDKPRYEVWGLPWQSATRFPGLAYCIGGRSIYWGGWSPELLNEELSNSWPASVVSDLKAATLSDGSSGYFHQSSDQIGVSETNDFIFGELHSALREQLFNSIATVTEAIPFASLPDHPTVRYSDTPVTPEKLAALLGIPPGAPHPSVQQMKDQLKLEAPLAVQGQGGHAGFFPFNKFSAVPLLIKGTREAYAESNGDDNKKRLMVVPNCHVIKLNVVNDGSSNRVDRIDTNLGSISLPANGKVVIALGTIESTRIALNSFKNKIPPNGYSLIGKNLMAHLRSNLNVLIPRQALTSLPATVKALQASALFVKCSHKFLNSTDVGYYHFQITASGGGATINNSEAELFKKLPDIDTLNEHLKANDTHVMITIRGIGEMQPQNPNNNITEDLNPAEQEFDVQRAYVNINPNARDIELWNAMDNTAQQIAQVFANGQPATITGGRDGIGTTHHEAGTLKMGDNIFDSVTNSDGRFHNVSNAFALGPMLFPTIGSPNPMLTGVALARRMGDHLMPPALAMSQTDITNGFTYIFDGSQQQFNQWKKVGGGNFIVTNRTIIAQPFGEIGLLYYQPQKFENFILRLDFLLSHPQGTNNDNSGVFVRFRDPLLPVPDPNNPGVSYPYNNQAFVAVNTGFEIQIDDEARGDTNLQEPDGLFYNRMGAIYKIKDQGTNPGQQNYHQPPPVSADTWNQYEIQVNGNVYIVRLNGMETTRFERKATDDFRGNPPSVDAVSGFIGVQCHTGNVVFANIRIKTL